jgi:hypothetical protein
MRRIHRQIAPKVQGIDLELKPLHELQDTLKTSQKVNQLETIIKRIALGVPSNGGRSRTRRT